MTDELKNDLKKVVRGEVADDTETLHKMSRDTSIFERIPELVVSPKDAKDVSALVTEVARAREAGGSVSLTARAAGSDMSGGPLTTSIVVSFTPHMNQVIE